jgi:hypothetical protein
VFNRTAYRDKEVVGVFVRFSCAAMENQLFRWQLGHFACRPSLNMPFLNEPLVTMGVWLSLTRRRRLPALRLPCLSARHLLTIPPFMCSIGLNILVCLLSMPTTPRRL